MIRPRKTDSPKGTMTPMIDVVFLLLIFFLCLGFRNVEGKFDHDLPDHVGPNPTTEVDPPVEDLRLFLRGDGERTVVWVNETPVGEIEGAGSLLAAPVAGTSAWKERVLPVFEGAAGRLAEHFRIDPDRPVTLDVDPDVPYALVVAARDAIVRGAERAGLSGRVEVRFTEPRPGAWQRLGGGPF